MYYDYSKNLRMILNAQSRQMSLISSIPQKNLETLIKSANISSQILSTYNKPLLNSGYTNVINNTNIQDVLKLNIPSFFKNNNFQKNLFSDVALNKFVYSTRIPKNEILKMNYAFRNFNINITTTPTFTESINSTDPVNVEDQDKACNVSGRMFNIKHVQTSSKKYLNLMSTGIGGSASWDFLYKLIHNEPVNAPIYIWVLFISYVCYLLTNEYD